MNTVTLRAAVHSQLALADIRAALVSFFTDESGIDEAPSRMIWLAVAIGLALAAAAFVVTQFNTAQTNVPSPVAPTP